VREQLYNVVTRADVRHAEINYTGDQIKVTLTNPTATGEEQQVQREISHEVNDTETLTGQNYKSGGHISIINL
jgi:hypothetical protein